jgi:hypothetical protein
MLVAQVLAVSLLAQAAPASVDTDPASLISQLGAARYAQREAAGKALSELGRAALPALRAARGMHDPEVRTRAAALIEKIEAAQLTESTRVRLDFEDAPLREVARSLSRQLGARVALYPEDFPSWNDQRVTLREPAPVEFWKAVDQFCEAAGLQYFPNPNGFGAQRETVFALAEGSARTVTPNSDHGPFRVSLLGLHYQRDLNYGPAVPPLPPQPARARARPALKLPNLPAQRAPRLSEQFTAMLQVMGEPRLCLGQNGTQRVELLEAVDNRGNSLISSEDGASAMLRSAGYYGINYTPVVQLQAHLHRPREVGDLISKLRGVIPLTVSSRRPDPLVVPLIHASGKTFENADVQVTIHEIRRIPNSPQTALELSVKSGDAAGSAAEPREQDSFGLLLPRLDPQRVQIEIIDANGRTIPWYESRVDSDSSHVTLALAGPLPGTSLRELRYYTLTRATVSVPFEFSDIPMP